MTLIDLAFIVTWWTIAIPWKVWGMIFAAMFMSDLFWVLCIKSVEQNKAIISGLYAVGIFIPVTLVTIGAFHDTWLMIPAAAGHFLGTASTVWWKSRKT